MHAATPSQCSGPTGAGASLQVMRDHSSNVPAARGQGGRTIEPYDGNLDGDIKAAREASAPLNKRQKVTPKAARKKQGATSVSPQSCSGVPHDVVAEAWTLRRLWRRANKARCQGQGCSQTIGEGVQTSNTA